MATSLSITLSTNNLYSNKITNPTSTHVLPGLSPNRTLKLSTIPKHLRYTTSFSPRQTLVMTSTISGSPVENEDMASVLDTVKVLDLNENAIPISDLWKDRKAVMAFACHFVVFCRKRADYLATKKVNIIDASGVALVVIGPGSIDQPRAFTEQTKFIGEVYANPTHSSYEALQFASLKIIQLYMEGYRQDWKLSFERDTVTRGGWQQGGIIVVGPCKTNISYVHKDKEAGDDHDMKDILKACCS
ncbi:hypothetical protein I3843_09G179500 [Carya illinoinensis]|nr:hypothetical protein I3843_09G179500 [Carya illinoinensis]